MTSNVKLLPLPEPMRVLGTRGKDAAEAWCRANVAHATESLREQREFQAALIEELLPYQDEAVASRAEIETLRADKLDLEAALEYLESHREIDAMNQNGIIRALSEIRDEYGVEIHKLRAEVDQHKRRANAYFQTAEQQGKHAEQLAEALQKVDKQLDDIECESSADAWAVDRCHDTIEAALNQKEVPTMSDEVMKCPYCGEAAQVADRVEINLESYRGSVRARTDCCGSIIRVYPVLRLRAEKTDQGGRDDWGH